MSQRLAALTCGILALPTIASTALTAEAAPREATPTAAATALSGARIAGSTKGNSRKPAPSPTPTATTNPTPTTSPSPTPTETTTPAPTTTTPAPTTTTAGGAVFSSRVVASDTAVTDAAGRRWEPRSTGFGSWRTDSTTADIAGTNDDALYRQAAPDTKWYRLDTPAPAEYKVRLLFSELYWGSAGQRVFDVKAEGAVVASDVDVVKAVGKNAAYDLTFTVPVTDGRLDIEFVKKVDIPILAGVEVVSSTALPALPAVKPKVNLAPDSFFVDDIRSAPLAPNSAAASAHLQAQVTNNWGGVAAFNAYRYNNSFYEVGPETPKVDVAFYDCQNKGYTPAGLFDGAKQFVDVPIPADAVPATGTDKQLTIYDRNADKLWDFWVTEKQADGSWRACWGGRIDDVSKSQGTFAAPFGATATGLAMTPGAITIDEFRRGRVDHAMYLAIIDPARWDTFSWPANRSDGASTDPNAVMEGQRLRIDPSLDLSTIPMSPVARMVAEAAQKYGFVVADKAGAVAVITESGNKEKAATGVDPWDGLLAGPDYSAMQGFPWEHIQVLPKDYGKPAN